MFNQRIGQLNPQTLKHGARNMSYNLHTDKGKRMRKELMKILRV